MDSDGPAKNTIYDERATRDSSAMAVALNRFFRGRKTSTTCARGVVGVAGLVVYECDGKGMLTLAEAATARESVRRWRDL